MSSILSDIQTLVRHYSNDSSLTITSGVGLNVANLIYQGVCSPDFKLMGQHIGRRWPNVTREDTSITTTASTESYEWPHSPIFRLWPSLEYLDSSNSSESTPIEWVPSMDIWSRYDIATDGLPEYARLLNIDGEIQLSLRPNPDTTGDTVRITGAIKVDDFTDSHSVTIFIDDNVDRALAFFIAADFKLKRGETQRAMELVQQGIGCYPASDKTPTLHTKGFIQSWAL